MPAFINRYLIVYKNKNERRKNMKYYLLSGMNENYDFFDNIAEIFRKEIIKFNTIVYISGHPKNMEKSFKLAKSEKFLNIGIKFANSIVLDYSFSKEEVYKIINENKIVFLYGGDPYEQMQFIIDYGIKDLLKEKVIIGLSAGSINMCKIAVCTKDEDFSESTTYNGMGFLDFSIEPHFNINNGEVLEDLKKFSYKSDIYALDESAFIIIDNSQLKLYR